jgi:excisionase family DNA binding protein
MAMKTDVNSKVKHLRTVINLALEELEELEAAIEFSPAPDKWISTEEAATICGISRSTLNRYALTGKCEVERIGGRWKFPKSKVEDMSFLKKDAS